MFLGNCFVYVCLPFRLFPIRQYCATKHIFHRFCSIYHYWRFICFFLLFSVDIFVIEELSTQPIVGRFHLLTWIRIHNQEKKSTGQSNTHTHTNHQANKKIYKNRKVNRQTLIKVSVRKCIKLKTHSQFAKVLIHWNTKIQIWMSAFHHSPFRIETLSMKHEKHSSEFI